VPLQFRRLDDQSDVRGAWNLSHIRPTIKNEMAHGCAAVTGQTIVAEGEAR
jgi:hypothetical protein